jgi:hypothetical protein
MDDGCGFTKCGANQPGGAQLDEGSAAGPGDLAVAQRQLARFGERDEAGGSEAEVTSTPPHDIPQEPPLGPARVDLQVEAVAVRVAPRLAQVPDLHGRLGLLGVPPLDLLHRILPTSHPTID